MTRLSFRLTRKHFFSPRKVVLIMNQSLTTATLDLQLKETKDKFDAAHNERNQLIEAIQKSVSGE